MNTEAEVLSGQEPIASYPVDSDEPMSLEDAVRDLGSAREKALNPPAESAKEATADTELSVEDNADPEEVLGEPSEDDAEAEKLPPIDPPRSWTKEAREHWETIPREAQEEFARIEQGRERDFLRSQQETAEKLKGLTAKEQQAEQTRQQYEVKLPALMQALHDQNSAQYSDIKSMADVEKISNEIFRLTNAGDFIQAGQLQAYLTGWNVHQQKMATTKAELDQAEGRKSQQHQTDWSTLIQKENARATELIPDLADANKGPALLKRASAKLSELGFSAEELNDLANGKSRLPIYDHRIQQLIFDSLKLADIQKAKTVAAAKVVPLVQRPGTAKPATAGTQASIQALEKQLSNATGDRAVEISTQIYQLEQKAAARQKG